MLSPGDRVDNYVVEELIGEGGMAQVYRVRHVLLESHHALKILHNTRPSLRTRLLLEGRAQALLKHPNIVAVTDVLEIDGEHALVMELVDGPSLADLLEVKRLNPGEVDSVAQGIFDGVGAAHERGWMHRDLKPANILMQRAAGGWTPMITDFGLAKVFEGPEDDSLGATRTGTAMGTPPYMPPEQIRDAKSVDQRADVYAMGAILYELVCGQRAYDHDDLLQIYSNVASGNYVAPRRLAPRIPVRMESAIVGALRGDLERRIQSIVELRAVWNGVQSREATPRPLDRGEGNRLSQAPVKSPPTFELPAPEKAARTVSGPPVPPSKTRGLERPQDSAAAAVSSQGPSHRLTFVVLGAFLGLGLLCAGIGFGTAIVLF